MRYRSLALFLAGATLCIAADDLPAIPQTPKKPVTDDYQGVQVVDDYRWLEPSADAEVRKWSDQENVRARAYLDRPGEPRRDRRASQPTERQLVDSLFGADFRAAACSLPSRRSRRNGRLTWWRWPRPTILIPRARWSIPNVLDPSGSTTIDFYEPSLDGKLVAVSLSKGGTEEGSVSVFEVATGNQLSDSFRA